MATTFIRRRCSRNIPKEQVLFNQSVLNGIEFSLRTIIRDNSFEESYTTVLGRAILTEQEINEMGKVFCTISHRVVQKTLHSVNSLTITPKDIIPVIIQLIKYLQRAGYGFSGHIEEQNKVNNQLTLALTLLKGLDPTLRLYAFVFPICQAIWIYYFENYEIYE